MPVFYQDEWTTLLQRDARDLDHEIELESVGLTVTSPPYNVGISYDQWNDSLTSDEYRHFVTQWLIAAYKVTRPGGRIVINIPVYGNAGYGSKRDGLYVLLPLYLAALSDAGFIFRDLITWVKSDAEELNEIEVKVSGSSTAWGSYCSPASPYMRSFSEFIIVGHKETPQLQWTGEPDIRPKEFLKWSRNVWLLPPETSRKHPAPFHVELPYRAIKLYSYPGDVVLDPFVGSGTTLVAARMLGRPSIGTDVSASYLQMAAERVAQDNAFAMFGAAQREEAA